MRSTIVCTTKHFQLNPHQINEQYQNFKFAFMQHLLPQN